jgi:hypothetical protein
MRNWRLWIGALVSVVCFLLAAWGVNLTGLWRTLRQVRLPWLLVALALLALAMVARAYRWRLLFYPPRDLRLLRLFNLLNIGNLVNSVSPLRLGDVVRAYLCAEVASLSAMLVLSTVIVERIVDTLTIVVLFVLLLPFVSLPARLVAPAVAVGAAGTAAVVVLVLATARRGSALALLEQLSTRLPILQHGAVRTGLTSAIDGLAVLGSRRSLAGAALWSLAAWLATAVQFHVVMQAMGLRLPFAAALLMLCLTTLGMVVPSSPGYLGVFEYLTVLSLAFFGIAKEAALSCALVVHALGYLTPIVLGSMAIWIEGLSYARLRSALSRAEARRDAASSTSST